MIMNLISLILMGSEIHLVTTHLLVKNLVIILIQQLFHLTLRMTHPSIRWMSPALQVIRVNQVVVMVAIVIHQILRAMKMINLMTKVMMTRVMTARVMTARAMMAVTIKPMTQAPLITVTVFKLMFLH